MPQPPKNASLFSNSTISFSAKQRRRLSIRSSGDVSSETPTTETESEKSIDEAPKGPPSLISALNVERALRGIAITDADHYGRLGLQRGCSYEQVTVAYRNKVDELLNQGLDEEELSKKMDLLKVKSFQTVLSYNKQQSNYI
ncbi:hypothetical protein ES332_D05G044100v1 [Gossypium tomentosum]|uniref:Uncharacterized protein n=1 Tax=Gossypium tomentosum TaxID=34277 RepID=A0A5D2KR10_GOSTO|nr:hypothetical protein ES332_D05G044100v1 [Gossypium tomentosum]